MNNLGHFEFGINHKSWFDPKKYSDPNNINYWLEQWHLFYDYLIKTYKENSRCIFLNYNNFNNLNHDSRFLDLTKINNEVKMNFKIINREIKEGFDNDLYSSTLEIYNNIYSYI